MNNSTILTYPWLLNQVLLLITDDLFSSNFNQSSSCFSIRLSSVHSLLHLKSVSVSLSFRCIFPLLCLGWCNICCWLPDKLTWEEQTTGEVFSWQSNREEWQRECSHTLHYQQLLLLNTAKQDRPNWKRQQPKRGRIPQEKKEKTEPAWLWRETRIEGLGFFSLKLLKSSFSRVCRTA